MQSCADFREFVRAGRIRPAPNCHARRAHLIAWDFVIILASGCYRVARDNRRDASGAIRHPEGWHAWCKHLDQGAYRIDLNLVKGEDGKDLVEIVTVMEME